jgi:hypothetical protein
MTTARARQKAVAAIRRIVSAAKELTEAERALNRKTGKPRQEGHGDRPQAHEVQHAK